MPATRKVRLGETIRAELSEVIRRELRDPRLTAGLLSIVDVDVSADLKYATVYVSVFGDEKVRKDALNALRGASGVLRSELGHTKAFKSVPELHFRYDESLERGTKIATLIDDAAQQGESLGIPMEEEPVTAKPAA